MRPTRLAILIAALGFGLALLPAAGLERAWALWVTAWGLLATGLGIDAAVMPRWRQVASTLDGPDSLHVGEPGTARVLLQATTTRPIAFEALFDLSATLRAVGAVRGTLAPPGATLELPLLATRRGQALIEAVTVRYAGPLGLMQRTARVRFDHALAIVPNVQAVRQSAIRFLQDRRTAAGLRIEKYKGDGTEFDSVREFVVGDDSRAIHWRASARHRTLLRRQFRAERNHHIVLAIDSGRLMSEPLGNATKLDHAVSAALLMAYVGLKNGDRVGMFSFDAAAGLFAAPQSGMHQYRTLAHLSAGIDYGTAETNYTLALTTLLARLSRRSLVVVLTDFVDTVTAELMVENLGRLGRRHVVVLVSLRDPELDSIAATPPSSLTKMNRAVVASAMLNERQAVLQRLRRLGLFTIDAEPHTMGPELINRYLDIKRRELI